jgi:hypothetical protein
VTLSPGFLGMVPRKTSPQLPPARLTALIPLAILIAIFALEVAWRADG